MVITIRLGGFMSRRYVEQLSGKKFRSQARRRAQRMSDAANGASVEVRDENGSLIDYLMGESEYKSLIKAG